MPPKSETYCIICMKKVLDSEKAVCCDGACDRWFHVDCAKIPNSEYSKLAKDTTLKWMCNRIDCSADSVPPMSLLITQMMELNKKVDNLIGKFEDLKKDDIIPIKDDLRSLNEKMNLIEPRISESERRIGSLEKSVEEIQLNTQGSSKVEDVLSELTDRSRRESNLIFFNVKESSSRDLSTRINDDTKSIALIVSRLCKDIRVEGIKTFRLGKQAKDKTRPLKVILHSAHDVGLLLKNFSKEVLMEMDESYSEVSVTRDKTPSERAYLHNLRRELKERQDKGERDITIRYMNGTPKIVKNNPKNV